MKILPIIAASLLTFSVSAQASHELIRQPVVEEAPRHLDMHDLQHWLLGYPQVNLYVEDGIATVAGHVDSAVDVRIIIKQIEKTAGVRRVTNLISTD